MEMMSRLCHFPLPRLSVRDLRSWEQEVPLFSFPAEMKELEPVGNVFQMMGRIPAPSYQAFPPDVCVFTPSPHVSLLIIFKPYVTAVGGTKNINPEVVAFDAPNEFASGGGFSNYFARPSYQDSVVPAYVSSLNGQYKAFFNSSGRAYPDIAAQSQQFLIVWNGTMVRVDGTRCVACIARALKMKKSILM
jgi:hypothetical protein